MSTFQASSTMRKGRILRCNGAISSKNPTWRRGNLACSSSTAQTHGVTRANENMTLKTTAAFRAGCALRLNARNIVSRQDQNGMVRAQAKSGQAAKRGRQGDTNWNGHRFFGLKAIRNGAPTEKDAPRQDRTPCSISACRQLSPRSRPKGSIVRNLQQRGRPIRHLRTNGLGDPAARAGPKACQVGSRKDPSEFPRQARAVQEVQR